VILCAVGWCARQARRQAAHPAVLKGAFLWLGLIVGQALLGVLTVWLNKPADIATLHVLTGAAGLAWGVVLSALAFRLECVNAPSAARWMARPENTVAGSSQPTVQAV
jgi:heme A synthase